MPVDRLRPRYSLRSMACLLRIAPSSYHYHHARIGVDKYAGLRARVARAVLLQCLLGGFGSVFPQCGLMVFPGAVIVSR